MLGECIEAELRVLGDVRILRAIKASISPDNESPPRGFRIKEELKDSSLTIEIKGPCDSIPQEIITVLSIIDEVTRLVGGIKELVNSYKPCE